MNAIEAFAALRVFTENGLRAPHKPLLLLYALARLRRDGRTALPFTEIERPVGALIRAYAPPGSQARAQDPFRYLEFDGLWRMQAANRDRLLGPGNAARLSELRGQNVRGGFTDEWLERFKAQPGLIDEAAALLLDRHFPPSLHEEILERVGLELGGWSRARRRKRDPGFVLAVRGAYFGQCAFCGFDLRLGGEPVALEAAHIRWHALGGADAVSNGLALCVLHHRLFDKGVLTVDFELRLRVSDHALGGSAAAVVQALDRQPLRRPRLSDHHPAPEALRWHHWQVFRSSRLLSS